MSPSSESPTSVPSKQSRFSSRKSPDSVVACQSGFWASRANFNRVPLQPALDYAKLEQALKNANQNTNTNTNTKPNTSSLSCLESTGNLETEDKSGFVLLEEPSDQQVSNTMGQNFRYITIYNYYYFLLIDCG